MLLDLKTQKENVGLLTRHMDIGTSLLKKTLFG